METPLTCDSRINKQAKEGDPFRSTDLAIAAIKYWEINESDDEVVYIVNRGAAVDLNQGLEIRDKTGNSLLLNSIIKESCLFPPKGLLRIHSGSRVAKDRLQKTYMSCGQLEGIDVYWTGARIWDDGKDVAQISESPDDQRLYEYTYPPFSSPVCETKGN